MGFVTINTLDYQIYGEPEAADVYLDIHLGATAWSTGDTDFKSKVLVMTTRLFDRIKWKGEIAVDGQAIAWPRINTGLPDVVADEIPVGIMNGFYEMVAILAEDPSIINSSTSGSNVQRAKGGDAEVWFFRSTVDTAPRYPTSVNEWIKRFLGSEDGILSLDTGTYTEPFISVFDEPPERSGGLY